MAFPDPPRALLFDVFGTCVNWRKTVVDSLIEWKHRALNDASASLASALRLRASNLDDEDWGRFAQEWRNSYMTYVRGIARGDIPPSEYKTIDEHHYESLLTLVHDWDLVGLWRLTDIQTISLVWHRLEPWKEAPSGIRELNKLYWTCTLSNGNMELLRDLAKHGKLEWTHIFSSNMWDSYKPSPKVYLGAAKKLGLQPGECAMIAAHLGDLKAAKSNGLKTIYVERPQEETMDRDEAKREGFVDLWVRADEDGFVALAEKLGVDVDRTRKRGLSAGANNENVWKKGMTDAANSL
ncbi:haloacid dehalogenase [Viridothelium virens]|uniref:Haloacid dehalogenase n=1 Tax=Viridothelium virens TaxID=1048519 RepID=A0A6A6GWT4_VIRVR|nr:haloacid dehalogenase [Viridothelium virens]